MQVFSRVHPRRSVITIMIALTLVVAACSGGARPTLTGDRLDESAATTTNGVAQQPATDSAEAGEQPATDSAEAGEQPATDSAEAGEQPATDSAEAGEDPAAESADEGAAATPLPPGTVEQLGVEILETIPRNQLSYTQGLELHDGFLFESTGSRGPENVLDDSRLQRVDPATGQIEQSIAIAQPFFAEGLTKVGDQLIQLTWKSNVAFYWNASSFELEKEVTYPGQGWGVCYDGNRLAMTDGTNSLAFRDPTTFEELSRVSVTLNGQPFDNLNEIECVNGVVWANVFGTDLIVRIDPTTGTVNGVVDASSLERPLGDGGAVLNGIAWDESTSSFYITGKLWPTMYRVNFTRNPAD